MWRALGWERGGEPARAICQAVSQRYVPPSFAPSTLSASASAEAEPQSRGRSHVGAVGRSFEGRKDAVDQCRVSISECCPVKTVPRDEEFTLQTTTCVSYPGTELPAGGEKVVFHILCKIVGAKDGDLCGIFLQMFKGRNVAKQLLLLFSTRFKTFVYL